MQKLAGSSPAWQPVPCAITAWRFWGQRLEVTTPWTPLLHCRSYGQVIPLCSYKAGLTNPPRVTGHCGAGVTENRAAPWDEHNRNSRYCTLLVPVLCSVLPSAVKSFYSLHFLLPVVLDSRQLSLPGSANRLMGLLHTGIIRSASQSSCYILPKAPSYDLLQ